MSKNKNITALFFFFVIIFGLSFIPEAHAQVNYTLLEKIPGFDSTDGSNLPAYITAIYRVALIIVTLSAVLMLSVGGFMYLTSAGNTSSISTAKSIITDSIIGLIIALVAWLVLNVINPDLTTISIGKLASVQVSEPGAGQTALPVSGACTTPNPSSACCLPGARCQTCEGCTAIPSSVPNKGCGLSTCFLNTALLTRIQNISGVTGWRITESWPPTVNHRSACHQTGQCADLNNSGGPTDPTTIKRYYDAFTAAGLNVLYETTAGCSQYEAVGVTNCGTYSSMTNGSSFHVR